MADRIFLPKIHRVTFGVNPGDRASLGYTVGHKVSAIHPNIIVSSIDLDESLFEKYGKVSCAIWAVDKSKSENEAFLYKLSIDVPLTLSSDLDKQT